jgi:hypothetical protein
VNDADWPPAHVEVRDVASGWQGVAHHGDGTATKTWKPTEDAAEAAAKRLLGRDAGGEQA